MTKDQYNSIKEDIEKHQHTNTVKLKEEIPIHLTAMPVDKYISARLPEGTLGVVKDTGEDEFFWVMFGVMEFAIHYSLLDIFETD